MKHKRSIVVPKTQEAIEKLDYDTASEEDMVTWSVTDKEFSLLYSVLMDINKGFNTLIDDYEDDSVVDVDKLSEMRQYLINVHLNNDQTNGEVIKRLISFFEEAIKRETGVFFYF